MSILLRTLTVFTLSTTLVALAACDEAGKTAGEDADTSKAGGTVAVHVINAEGKLVGPIEMPVVRKASGEWAKILDTDAFRIMRRAGTEQPHCGDLLDNKKSGVYACAGCKLPLFASDSKFVSGTGWPSFFQPVAKGNVAEIEDSTHGMRRVEIRCARCEGHLGHVFNDGPKPTGLRYCLNSASLGFTDSKDIKTLVDPYFTVSKTPASDATPERAEIVLAGGCFWCVEAVFEQLVGVHEAISGYAGGKETTAFYPLVSNGTTGHAEAVKIIYDPSKITLAQILKVHFTTHDATTLNRQGADRGKHYRSAIFYKSDAEKQAATDFLAKWQAQGGDKIVTTLEPLEGFYPAEPKHQDYVSRNPKSGYVRGVAMPKVKKAREKFKVKPEPAAPAPVVEDGTPIK